MPSDMLVVLTIACTAGITFQNGLTWKGSGGCQGSCTKYKQACSSASCLSLMGLLQPCYNSNVCDDCVTGMLVILECVSGDFGKCEGFKEAPQLAFSKTDTSGIYTL